MIFEKRLVTFEIKKLENRINRLFVQTARKNDMDELTIAHGKILGFLYRNSDKDVFQKDIEQALCITRSTVTSIVKLMEQKNYITRVSVDSDARLKKLVLTEKGREMHYRAIKSFDETEAAALEGLTKEEISQFVSVAGKISENLVRNLAAEQVEKLSDRNGGNRC